MTKFVHEASTHQIIGTVKEIDLSHRAGGASFKGGLSSKWARITLQKIAPEYKEQFAGIPHFEWMNSDLDAQAAALKPGDRVRIELNDLSIPTRIERV